MPDATNFLFDIGVASGFEIPQYFIAAFKNTVNDQTSDSSVIEGVDFTECFCKTGPVSYPDDGMTINYGKNIYNAAYKEIVI